MSVTKLYTRHLMKKTTIFIAIRADLGEIHAATTKLAIAGKLNLNVKTIERLFLKKDKLLSVKSGGIMWNMFEVDLIVTTRRAGKRVNRVDIKEWM